MGDSASQCIPRRLNGRIRTMTVTMDSAGRLVIPRSVRNEAGLEPGVPLDIRWRDGVIEIEPAMLAVAMERRGRLAVAVAANPVPPLTSITVERTRRELRRGRR